MRRGLVVRASFGTGSKEARKVKVVQAFLMFEHKHGWIPVM